jgi:hypothetical protein
LFTTSTTIAAPLRRGGKLLGIHQKAAVAGEADDGSIQVPQLCGDRGRQSAALGAADGASSLRNWRCL